VNVYGSDPYAYDFEAALNASAAGGFGEQTGAERRFERHARLYGVDCVLVSATSLSPVSRVRLKLALREVAKEHKRKRKPETWWKDAPDVDAGDVRTLAAAGLVPMEIVRLIGWTSSRVERALADTGDPEEIAAEPHNQAAKNARMGTKLASPGNHPRSAGSSRRRRDAIALSKRGMTSMAIADTLGLSDATVRRYLAKGRTAKPRIFVGCMTCDQGRWVADVEHANTWLETHWKRCKRGISLRGSEAVKRAA
jgi:hypothetical protein